MRKKLQGGLIAFIGFILSPLTWWNDFIINIPLAYLFALPFALVSKELFLPAMILGYWLTNIAGFLLMHYGVHGAMGKKKYAKKDYFRDILVSIAYTVIVIILILTGIIRFPTDYP